MKLLSQILIIVTTLFTLSNGQTAGPSPTLIYTYAGQSAPASLLSAISSAAAIPNALMSASGGADTATGRAPAFPTTTTVGPAAIPQLTGSNVFTSAASGEIFPTATRPPYTVIGTYNTTLPSSTGASSSVVIRSSGFSLKLSSSRRFLFASGLLVGSYALLS